MWKKIKQLLEPSKTFSQRVARSGMWVGALRITDHLFRLVRIIILARLLAPHDFGLMGIAFLAISALDTFSEIGFSVALVQKKENIEKYLNTAWVVQVIRGVVLFSILFTTAPLLAAFFNSHPAITLIRVIAFTFLFKGLTNIGVVYFQKELKFNKQFIYQISGTVTNLVVAISIALILRNVWALVFGFLAGEIVRSIISYVIHPYRPRVEVDWKKAKELFGFGKWVLGYAVIAFIAIHGAEIFLGKILGVLTLGFYQMAFRISYLVKAEIGVAFSLVTLPTFSKLQENIPKLREVFLKSLELIIFISIPISTGIILLGSDFTRIFLGEKWMPMVPALQILAIPCFIWAISEVIKELFKSIGYPKLVFWMYLSWVGVIAVTIFPLTTSFKLAGTAMSVLLAISAPIPIWWHKAAKIVGVTSYRLFKEIVPSLVGAFVMSAFITITRQSLPEFGILGFFFLVLTGVLSYIGSLLFLWKKFNYGPIGSLLFIKQSLQR